MKLQTSPKVFFTPGPSQLYPGFDRFMADALESHIMSISHRGAAFSNVFNHTAGNLRTLLEIPDDYHVYFVGSATEAMERIVQNTVESRSHHFVNGAFSERFYEMALELGKDATATVIPWGQGFGASDMAVPEGTELAAFTHNETSTGAAMRMADIYSFKQANPNVLVAIDVVSSLPIVRLDFTYLDCVFFSVQKVFGLPAGLGVIIVSPAAFNKASRMAEAAKTGGHHSFKSLAKSAGKAQTPATPNVLGIYLLGRVAEDMNAAGITRIRQTMANRSAKLYELLDNHEYLRPFVQDLEHRSQTVVVAEISDAPAFVKGVAEHGLVIGGGYGKYRDSQVRIANFPAVSDKQMRRLVGVLREG